MKLFHPCFLVNLSAFPLASRGFLHRQREREGAKLVILIILKSWHPLCLGDLQPHGPCNVHHPGKQQENTVLLGQRGPLRKTLQKERQLFHLERKAKRQKQAGCLLASQHNHDNISWKYLKTTRQSLAVEAKTPPNWTQAPQRVL